MYPKLCATNLSSKMEGRLIPKSIYNPQVGIILVRQSHYVMLLWLPQSSLQPHENCLIFDLLCTNGCIFNSIIYAMSPNTEFPHSLDRLGS
jgi:hypothetical protein